MNILDEIKTSLSAVFAEMGYGTSDVIVTFSNRPAMCDVQCNSAFALAKKYGKAPNVIASEIVAHCDALKHAYDISVCGGFINFTVKAEKLSLFANDILNGEIVEKNATSKKIIMDYGGANVAKELHVGHLRSPLIGESIKRLHMAFGDTVISDTHLGDWGLQMGLTIAQLKDDGYLDGYFDVGENKPITLDILNEEYPKASLRKKTDADFYKKAEDFTLYLQQKKQPYYDVWKDIRAISVSQIEKDYAKLNCTFDRWYGESTCSPDVPTVIDIFKSKNLCRYSDGALVVDVAREGEHVPLPKKNPDDPNEPIMYANPMPPAVIQKHNGGELYATTDLATIYERAKEHPDAIIYCTDNRQETHFKQVFRCARMAGLVPDSTELVSVLFGTMNGTDGKPFKTRDGGTVKLSDVINLLTDKAKEKLDKNGLEYDEKLPLMIGVAAMKFGDLSNTVTKDYVFDLDRFASFEGKTGPYLQYTAVRIKSLIEKSDKIYGDIVIDSAEQKNIVMSISRLIESLKVCYKDHSLNALCESTYNLANAFSTFYNNTKILSEPDATKRASYLSLCRLVGKVLAFGLDILAIDIPDRM